MLPVLQVGPLAIQVPGLILLAGLWLGLSMAERYADRYKIVPSDLYNLAFIVLIASVAGARLFFVARYPHAFQSSPISLISTNPGLLDPLGGLVTGVVAGLIYCQRKGLGLWLVLDALTPAFAILTVAQGLSHLASGVAFGAPSGLPWSIEMWGMRRHPAQLYEILAAILILWCVWPGRGLLHNPRSGTRFLTFLALSASARLFLEAFRGDSSLLPDGLRTAQVIAWILLALSLWGLGKLLRRDHVGRIGI